MPPVVKNLLLLNILFFVATLLFQDADLTKTLGLYNPSSPNFQPFQLVTHMFMHGGFFHILFNMYALVLFGSSLERIWGPKRFFTYYVLCGLGAACLHMGVNYWEIIKFESLVDANVIDILNNGKFLGFERGTNFPAFEFGNQQVLLNEAAEKSLFYAFNVPMVGASGAVYGLLLGFGMFFPNLPLYLLFVPVPIKAKYFVIIFGAIELFQGFNASPGDNVAHFAHLGGILIGILIIQYWRFSSKR